MISKLEVKFFEHLKPRHAAFAMEYLIDNMPRRAAVASGFEADDGYELLKQEDISMVIQQVMLSRIEPSDIDVEWSLMQAVDNLQIARQKGNISASNTALNMIMKHSFVDAYAAEKVEINSDKEIMKRLQRGRKRARVKKTDDEDISFI